MDVLRAVRRKASAQVLAPMALLVILVADIILRDHDLPFLVVAVLDESGHLATTVLLLLTITVPSGFFAVAALLTSTLIDLDHIPHYLEWGFSHPDLARPRPHSLTSVALALVVAFLARGWLRQVALGVAFGLTSHLIRDMATGGVTLFWPLSFRDAVIPYALYAVLMAGLAGAAWMRAASIKRKDADERWWKWWKR